MKYCYECGQRLRVKELEHEGMVPFCDSCRKFRFPIFSTAISMVTLNPKQDKILMIQTRFTDDVEIDGFFILVPDLDSYKKIMESLGMA